MIQHSYLLLEINNFLPLLVPTKTKHQAVVHLDRFGSPPLTAPRVKHGCNKQLQLPVSGDPDFSPLAHQGRIIFPGKGRQLGVNFVVINDDHTGVWVCVAVRLSARWSRFTPDRLHARGTIGMCRERECCSTRLTPFVTSFPCYSSNPGRSVGRLQHVSKR